MGASKPTRPRRTPASVAPPAGANRRIVLLLPILWIALVAAYHPAIHGGVLWDDDDHLTRPELQSAEGLRRIWTEPGATQQYYPLAHSAFWIQARLWGHDTPGYHLVNITLHAISAFLLVLILRRLSIPGAMLAGFAFALHPVQVESVAWITELKNTLSGVFYFLAALVYLRFDAERRRSWYLAATALFLLALMSKTVTATLPAALLVVFWWQRGRLRWREDVRPLLPWLGLGVTFGLVTVWAERTLIGATGSEFDLSAIERVLVAGRAFWFYLATLLWPANLMFIYPRWTIDAGAWWQYLFPATALGLAAALWTMRHRTRAPLAVVLLFGGTLFPALGFFNVYPFRYSFVADHFQYLACASVVAAMSALATGVLGARLSREGARAAAAVALVVLGVLTWRQSRQYADAETLYLTTIERNPGCWMAYNNLGAAALQRGTPAEIDRALGYLQESVRLYPDNPEARNNLGFAWQKKGRYDLARAEHEAALRLKPGYFEATLNLAVDLQEGGRPDDSLPHYEAAIALNPRHARAHYSYGSALHQLGRLDDAVAAYHRALSIDRRLLEAHHNLGMVHLSAGRLDEAVAAFEAALAIDAGAIRALDGLGYALMRLGRPDEAIGRLERAVQIDPSYVPAQRNLAHALQQSGRLDAAVARYQELLKHESGPSAAETHNNLGAALAELGRVSEAAQHFREALRIDPTFAAARSNLARIR